MKNADIPAMPCTKATGEIFVGMSKREMIAMHIMASTCWDTTDRNNPTHYKHAASSSVQMADALLKELEK